MAMIRTFDGIGSSGPDVVFGRVRRYDWASALVPLLRSRSSRPVAS